MFTSDERAVLAANDAYYEAFRARDADAMEELWAEHAPVACIHPGWSPLRERSTILRSYRAIFRGGSSPLLEPEDAAPSVLGAVAYVICYERIVNRAGEETGVLVATNFFVRESGSWRMAHHQAGPVAAQDDEDDDEPEPPTPPRSLPN